MLLPLVDACRTMRPQVALVKPTGGRKGDRHLRRRHQTQGGNAIEVDSFTTLVMESLMANSMVAPHIVLLGEALQPVLRKVETQLDASTTHPTHRGETYRDVSERVLDEVQNFMERLANEISQLNKRVVSAADPSDAAVHRSVGRLEVVIDELLDSHAHTRRICSSTHERGHLLLLALLRRILTRIRTWLRDLVEATEDPRAVLKRKGLPTSGHVHLQLDVDLDLDDTLELREFNDWVIERSKVKRRGNGSGNGLIAFAAGIFLGGLFFGDDD